MPVAARLNAGIKMRPTPMTSTKANQGPSDPEKIDLTDLTAMLYWVDQFGVPREAIEAAVAAVGPKTVDVEARLVRPG